MVQSSNIGQVPFLGKWFIGHQYCPFLVEGSFLCLETKCMQSFELKGLHNPAISFYQRNDFPEELLVVTWFKNQGMTEYLPRLRADDIEGGTDQIFR